MKLADKHAVRFAKVMTCLNIGCPLGMGLWEGVPLREVVWLTQPKENLRRVFYYGYHNDDPKQMFQSSLPIGRVLEDYFDLPPVIVCYKLNGQWLEPKRGGPVRDRRAGGLRLQERSSGSRHVVLTNLAHANDTYANGNNDIDSPLKTFAATLSVPTEVKSGEAIPITGYAQVGICGAVEGAGLDAPRRREMARRRSVFHHRRRGPTRRCWVRRRRWGGGLADDAVPKDTIGFDAAGKPRTWPMRLGKVHWAALLPGLPAGDYALRCADGGREGRGAADAAAVPQVGALRY